MDVRPCRGAGGKVGRFLPKAPEWVRSERTRSLPGGGRPERAAKAGKGGRLGDRGPIWGTPVRGGLLVGNCVLLARCPHLFDRDYFPGQGKIIVVEHISPDRPPTRALMRRSYRTPSIPTPSYPGLHPGLVCRAPLGHPLESSTALSRPVEATPMNYQRLYLGSLRHCSLLPGDRLCVRGGAGFGDRLLGGRQMF